MKSFYEILYRYFRAPWDIGPRNELVALVESGRLEPCRAIDLGSGTASNCLYLAQHGFDVTGVDFAQAAVDLGRKRAKAAGVRVNFIVDDLTNLRQAEGTYDLLVDYGTLDDLSYKDRERYVQSILSLTHGGTQFVLYCFEWEPRRWERLLGLPQRELCLPGEIQARFGRHFEIEKVAGQVDYSKWPSGYAVYLMRRSEKILNPS